MVAESDQRRQHYIPQVSCTNSLNTQENMNTYSRKIKVLRLKKKKPNLIGVLGDADHHYT